MTSLLNPQGFSNWENNRTQPQVQYYAKVIEVLGYFPFDIDTSKLGGRLKEFRIRAGVRKKKVTKLMGVDESTICGWERNENIPLENHMKNLMELLE